VPPAARRSVSVGIEAAMKLLEGVDLSQKEAVSVCCIVAGLTATGFAKLGRPILDEMKCDPWASKVAIKMGLQRVLRFNLVDMQQASPETVEANSAVLAREATGYPCFHTVPMASVDSLLSDGRLCGRLWEDGGAGKNGCYGMAAMSMEGSVNALFKVFNLGRCTDGMVVCGMLYGTTVTIRGGIDLEQATVKPGFHTHNAGAGAGGRWCFDPGSFVIQQLVIRLDALLDPSMQVKLSMWRQKLLHDEPLRAVAGPTPP
jgi:hypothetical protein